MLMKTILLLILVLTLIPALEAQQPTHRVKILKIEGLSQQTPKFQVSGPSDKAPKPRYWMEIEAEIEVETKDPSGFIPELEAQWFAVIMDKFSKEPVRLMGKTTFKNVSTKDKKIFLSAYIEPDTLERLTGSTRPSENDIEGYALMISGAGISTLPAHVGGLTMATAEKDAKWWITWPGKNLDDMIVPKSQTPFFALWTDRYPTEKVAGR